jgi:predicted RND superfamily exporter protein
MSVDYGIYTAARIRDEVRRGASISDAVATTLRNTGGAVLSTFAASNMTLGILLLSSYINWRAPIFICALIN